MVDAAQQVGKIPADMRAQSRLRQHRRRDLRIAPDRSENERPFGQVRDHASSSSSSAGAPPTKCGTPRSTPWKPISGRSEEHTSELQSLMRISYAVFCLKNKKPHTTHLQ